MSQEPCRPDGTFRSGRQAGRAAFLRRNERCAAVLCRPVCVLQEVHGAVHAAKHRPAHARPGAHLPKVPARVRRQTAAREPAQVSVP